jgi:predicted amidophosphoribosyltransferase
MKELKGNQNICDNCGEVFDIEKEGQKYCEECKELQNEMWLIGRLGWGIDEDDEEDNSDGI